MAIIFPDKMPKGPRLKAGGFGEYFEEGLWQGKSTTVYASTADCFWWCSGDSREGANESGTKGRRISDEGGTGSGDEIAV